MIQSLPRAAGCYATTTQFLRELRETCGSGGDCGSTSPRSRDELAQLRTHVTHYSPCDDCPFVDQFIARRLQA